MKTLEIPNLPDEIYEEIEKLARVRGKAVSEVAADFIAKGLRGDDIVEAQLLADIRADREEMARRGVPFLTEAALQQMKREGRE